MLSEVFICARVILPFEINVGIKSPVIQKLTTAINLFLTGFLSSFFEPFSDHLQLWWGDKTCGQKILGYEHRNSPFIEQP
jgi:hypothetical protein